MPVHLLNELVKQTPEGVYLTTIKQDGQTVARAGVAQTNERVSEFLRNTVYNSQWLDKPELIEIKAAGAAQGWRSPATPVRASRCGCRPKRPQAAPTPAAGSARHAGRGRRKATEVAPWPPSPRNVGLTSAHRSRAPRHSSGAWTRSEPGQWPMLPKLTTCVAARRLVVVLGWFLLLSDRPTS